jgi:transcriptional regulator with XRE-family HTH domain
MHKKRKEKKMEYGKKIEEIRKVSGLTVEKFVVVMEISKRSYFYILSGEQQPRPLTVRRINELAKEYGVKDHGDK